jgi:hypothetical protein
MVIKPMMVMTYDLTTQTIKRDTYVTPKYIPMKFYNIVVEWLESDPDLSDIYVSISDRDGSLIVPTYKGKCIVVDGLGMLEIEFRGAIYDIDLEDFETISINKATKVILHLSNGELAFAIDVTKHIKDKMTEKLMDFSVSNKVGNYFTITQYCYEEIDDDLFSVCTPTNNSEDLE